MFQIYFGCGQYLSDCSLSFVNRQVHTVQAKDKAARMPHFQAIEVLRHVRCHGFSAWLIAA